MVMANPLPDLCVLDSLLHYESDTGALYWRVSAGGHVKPGDIAGSLYKNGYRHIRINTRSYLSHRIAYSIHHRIDLGQLLKIDHINGDRADNRISNLRLATNSQNLLNQKKRTGSSSEYFGVFFHKTRNRWVTRVTVDGRQKEIGTFTSETSAARAYDNYVKQHGSQFQRVNFND